MSNRHQREGSISNAHEGRNFENLVKEKIKNRDAEFINKYKDIINIKECAIPIGNKNFKKNHKFDLCIECENKMMIIIECKDHTWSGKKKNPPSAKIHQWISAMYAFALTDGKYRKIFIAKRYTRNINRFKNDSVMDYFIRNRKNYIPDDVELWEYDEENDTFIKKYPKE